MPFNLATAKPVEEESIQQPIQTPVKKGFNLATAKPVEEESIQQPIQEPIQAPVVQQVEQDVQAPIERAAMPAGLDYGADTDLMGLGGYDQSDLETTAERSYIRPEEIAQDKEQMGTVRKWLKTRYPNKALPEDDIGVAKAFQETLAKGDIDIASDLSWALNATEEQKAVAREVQPIIDTMPTQLSDEFWATVNPVRSPSTYLTGGLGLAIKKVAAQKLGATAVSKAITAGSVTAIEGLSTAATDLASQKAQKELGIQDEVSYLRTAVSFGIGAAFGATGGVSLAKTIKDPKAEFKSLVQRKTKPTEQLRKEEQEFLNKFAEREKSGKYEPLFDSPLAKKETRKTSIDAIDEPKEVTEAVLNKQNVKNIYATAKQLFKDDPSLIPDDFKEKKISQIVIDVLNKSDADTIQQAAARAGIDNATFLDAFKVTISDAGEVLNGASDMARFFSKMTKGVDPELDDIFERMSKAGNNQMYWGGGIISGARKITDASVGAAVAGLSTTFLNTAGLVGAMTIETAVDTLESVFKHTGRLVSDMRGDVPITKGRIKQATQDMMRDSFSAISSVFDSGYSTEVYNSVMKYNPRLNGMLLQSAQEADKLVGGGNKFFDGMNKTVNLLNTVNRSVEAFVRKPMLVHNLRLRMDEMGLDFEDYVANNKAIPASLIQDAVDDTLALTFSSAFKKTGEKSIEGRLENFAAETVSAINRNDIFKTAANVTIPFYRFGMNGIRYSYRLTPGSAVGGLKEFTRSRRLMKEADVLQAAGDVEAAKVKKAEAAGLAFTGKRKMIEGAIGTGIIAMAMGEREKNADLPFNQTRDRNGEVHDISTLAPASFIYAMADAALYIRDIGKDYMYSLEYTKEERIIESERLKKQALSLAATDETRKEKLVAAELMGGRLRDFDGTKFTEIMAGWGRMAGTQKTIFDEMKNIMEDGIEATKLKRTAGTAVGDFLSRFDNAFNPIYDVMNMMRDDFRQVESRGETTLGFGEFGDAVVASLASNIPYARDILEDKPSLFQEKTPQLPLAMRYVTGERPTTPTTRIESELLDIGIEPYKLYKRSGDRVFDNARVEVARDRLTASLNALFDDKAYKEVMTDNERVDAVNLVVNGVFSETKEAAQKLYAERKGGEKEISRQYSNLPKKQRQAAEDRFYRENNREPTTVEDKISIIQGDYNTARKAASAIVDSKLKEQTEKAFGQ